MKRETLTDDAPMGEEAFVIGAFRLIPARRITARGECEIFAKSFALLLSQICWSITGFCLSAAVGPLGGD